MINLIILEEIRTKLIFEFLNLRGINISSNSIILHLFYYPKIKKKKILRRWNDVYKFHHQIGSGVFEFHFLKEKLEENFNSN